MNNRTVNKSVLTAFGAALLVAAAYSPAALAQGGGGPELGRLGFPSHDVTTVKKQHDVTMAKKQLATNVPDEYKARSGVPSSSGAPSSIC